MTQTATSPGATQSQASGSSFYAAMRLLPPAERQAMFAIYSFCRQVDDIADEPHFTQPERVAGLNTWRDDLEALYAGDSPASLAFLKGPIEQFSLAKADFLAIIDGMQMDVDTTIRAPDFATFDLYCDRVASAVGRLSVRVFGMSEVSGRQLAYHLGRALQFTNILRDLDEDAQLGRLYLPKEALLEAGIHSDTPGDVVADSRVGHACLWLAAKAHDHYRASDNLLNARPAGRLRAPRLMSAVYGEILRQMQTVGWAAPRRRVKLGKARLAWLVLSRGLLP